MQTRTSLRRVPCGSRPSLCTALAVSAATVTWKYAEWLTQISRLGSRMTHAWAKSAFGRSPLRTGHARSRRFHLGDWPLYLNRCGCRIPPVAQVRPTKRKPDILLNLSSIRKHSISFTGKTKSSRPKGRAAGCTVSRDRWCNSCTLFPWFQRRLRRGGGPKLLRRWPRALGRSRPSGSSGRLRRARHTILAGRWLALRP